MVLESRVKVLAGLLNSNNFTSQSTSKNLEVSKCKQSDF